MMTATPTATQQPTTTTTTPMMMMANDATERHMSVAVASGSSDLGNNV